MILLLTACATPPDPPDPRPRTTLAGHLWQVAQVPGYRDEAGEVVHLGAQWQPIPCGDCRVCLDFTGDVATWWDSAGESGELGEWSVDGALEDWGSAMTVGGEPWDVYAVPDSPRDPGSGLWWVEGPEAFGLYPGDRSCEGV